MPSKCGKRKSDQSLAVYLQRRKIKMAHNKMKTAQDGRKNLQLDQRKLDFSNAGNAPLTEP